METSIFSEAMDSIRDQMAAAHADGALSAIGEYLTELLKARPETAEAFAAGNKTLRGAYEAIEKYARSQKRQGACVCVSDDAAFEQVRKYYGIPDASMTKEAKTGASPSQGAVDSLDIDAFLGRL